MSFLDADVRILLIGKTGNGKSSLGNTLFGRTNVFKTADSMFSETKVCKWDVGQNSGKTIEIVDTPGLCDTHRLAEEIYLEVGKSLLLSHPGPHVIIFVLKCNRFTPEEAVAYGALKSIFSEEMCKYLIIAFNGIDVYAGKTTLAEQRAGLEMQLKDPRMKDTALPGLLEDAGGRYIGMNNSASDTVRTKQGTELLEMAMALKERNGGKHYDSAMLGKVKGNIMQLISDISVQQNMDKKTARLKAKRLVTNGFEDPTFWQNVTTQVGRFWKRAGNQCTVM